LLLEHVGLATGVTGPAGKRAGEIDVDHDPAQIEQQRIGGFHKYLPSNNNC
jgi:hypothetical protein